MPGGQAHPESNCFSAETASSFSVGCVVHNQSLQLCKELGSLASMVWNQLFQSSWPPVYAGCRYIHAAEEVSSLLT